jgi:hypothetical protein
MNGYHEVFSLKADDDVPKMDLRKLSLIQNKKANRLRRLAWTIYLSSEILEYQANHYDHSHNS